MSVVRELIEKRLKRRREEMKDLASREKYSRKAWLKELVLLQAIRCEIAELHAELQTMREGESA